MTSYLSEFRYCCYWAVKKWVWRSRNDRSPAFLGPSLIISVRSRARFKTVTSIICIRLWSFITWIKITKFKDIHRSVWRLNCCPAGNRVDVESNDGNDGNSAGWMTCSSSSISSEAACEWKTGNRSLALCCRLVNKYLRWHHAFAAYYRLSAHFQITIICLSISNISRRFVQRCMWFVHSYA